MYVCRIPNEAHDKVINIYTHKYFQTPKENY